MPKKILIAYKLVRSGSKYYGELMKIVERIKHKIKLVVAGLVIYALLILGLLIFIASRVG